MRAIKIDGKNQTVSEIEINGLKDMQKAVGGLIEIACRFFNEHNIERNTLFVDEEGLFKDYTYGFYLDGKSDPLLGDGIICGVNMKTGDTIDCSIDLKEIESLIKFATFTPEQLAKMQDSFSWSIKEWGEGH